MTASVHARTRVRALPGWRIATAACFILLSGRAMVAQVATLYTFAQSAGTYTEITGGTTLWSVSSIGSFDLNSFDDEISSAQTIPGFPFNGTTYTQMYVSANGFITFGSAPTGGNNTPLSSTEGYERCVAGFAADLNNAANGAGTRDVRWQTVGNEVVVQWRRVRRYNLSGEVFSFQIRLNTANGQIRVVYGAIQSGPNASTSNYPEVGLRGPSNAFATNVNNRLVGTGSENWASSLAGASNASKMRFTSTSPAKSWTSGLTYAWTPVCLPPTATASVGAANCATGTYSISVNVTALGSASSVTIQSPAGTNVHTNVGTGTYAISGIPIGTARTVTVVHNGNSLCNVPLGSFASDAAGGVCWGTATHPIPDNGCGTSNYRTVPLCISTPGTALGTNVYVRSVDVIVSHTYGSDLRMYLRSPSNTEVGLITTGRGGSGTQFGNAAQCPSGLFTFQAGGAALSGVASNSTNVGTWAPDQPLSGFHNGSNPNGTWSLRVCDAVGADVGAVQFARVNLCWPPSATYTVIENCPANQFSVQVNVSSFGAGSTANLAYSVNGGAPVNMNGLGLGNTVIGPFPATATVACTLTNGIINCGQVQGTLSSACPITVDCAAPVMVNYCYSNFDPRTFTFVASDPDATLTLDFIQGTIDPSDALFTYSGTSNAVPGSAIQSLSGSIQPTLAGASGTSTGNAMFMEIGSNASNSCADGQQQSWIFEVRCTPGCIDPIAGATVDPCTSTIGVEIFDMGDADGLIIQYTVNGGAPVTVPGIFDLDNATALLGPFVPGQSVEVKLLHSNDPGCNKTLAPIVVPSVPAAPTLVTSASPAPMCGGGSSQLSVVALGPPAAVNAYGFTTSTGATLADMAGATQLIASGQDDAASAVTGIGFTLQYGTQAFTQFSVNSNGLMRLGSTVVTNAYSNALSTTTNVPAIAPWWDDLYTATGGVTTRLLGNAGSYIRVVDWRVTACCTGGAATMQFQVWLYQATGAVEFRYGAAASPSSSSSVGITANPASTFQSVTTSTHASSTVGANDANAAWPGNGRLYRWMRPQVPGAQFAWSPGANLINAGTASPTVQGLAQTTTFTVDVIANGCPYSAQQVLAVVPPPTPAAAGGAQAICAGGTTTGLGGNTPAVGTGAWSIVSGGTGSFSPSAAVPNATFTHTGGAGPVVLRWTITGTAPCAPSMADVTVTINQPPTAATAGGGQTICAGGTTTGLGGNAPAVGTGAWSIVSGGTGTFSPSSASPNATFAHTGGAGPVVLRWTITNGSCAASTAQVSIAINQPPTAATVGGAQVICAGSTTTGLGGNAPALGTGAWSIVSGGAGTFSPSASAPNATFTHTSGAGPLLLRWTITGTAPCAPSTADVQVIIDQPPTTATVGGGQSICAGGTTTGLGGNAPAVGTGSWSIVSGGTGSFSPSSASPNAAFLHASGAGPVLLRWTIANGACASSAAEASITISQPPTTASTGGPQTICPGGTTVGLGGNAPTVGSGAWSIVSGGTGAFSPSPSHPDAVFTHASGAGPIVLRWTITAAAPCAQSTSEASITVNSADSDADGVPDCFDSCPALFGQIGDPCDAGPGFVAGQIDAGCACIGQACTTDLSLEFQLDGLSVVTWELRTQAGDMLVRQGTVYLPVAGTYTQATCLPDGCYRLVVMDDGGDGIVNGGYILRTIAPTGARVIDNRNNFHSGGLSQIAGGDGFCLPLGNDRLLSASSDRLDLRRGPTSACSDKLTADDSPNGTTGNAYQFWFYDPNGGLSFRYPANGGGPNQVAMNHPHLAALQDGVLYNVRVRTRDQANQWRAWGPASRMRVDNDAAQCRPARLVDDASNPNLSCGKVVVLPPQAGSNGSGNMLTAYAVKRFNAGCVEQSANRYQFRFKDVDTQQIVAVLNGNALPLAVNTVYMRRPMFLPCRVYEVEARASFNNGADWCPWGPSCTVYTGGCQQNLNRAAERPELRLYPNPNAGDRFLVSMEGLVDGTAMLSLEIFDAFGKRVLARTIPVQDGFINTWVELNGELAAGLYVVSLGSGNEVFTRRLVVQP
jgi:subtilisin-like proprotein convertase family protein